MSTQTIPKVINYFWFGNNPEPPIVKECIKSWKKYCPDYEIKRWDEKNFDINISSYTKEAYNAKKWAFVSDYARFYVLNKNGGVYLDTDVELIKSLDSILKKGPFMARENSSLLSVNSGIGMGTYANNALFTKVLNDYDQDHFINSDGSYNQRTVVERVSEMLVRDGLSAENKIQKVDNIYIYPKQYFCPIDYVTGEQNFSQDTIGIHHFAASWLSKKEKQYHSIGQKVGKVFGTSVGIKTEKIIRFPYKSMQRIKKVGIKNTIIYYFRKIKRN